MAVGFNLENNLDQAAAAESGIAAAFDSDLQLKDVTEIVIKWLPVIVTAAVFTFLLIRK